MLDLHTFKVKQLVKVSDGDTFTAIIDRSFYDYSEMRIRIAHINAYEKSGNIATKYVRSYFLDNDIILPDKEERKALARQGTLLLEEFLRSAKIIIVKSVSKKTDSFGRIIAEVYADDVNVGDKLLESNLIIRLIKYFLHKDTLQDDKQLTHACLFLIF